MLHGIGTATPAGTVLRVLLWFVIVAPVVVAEVFRSPMIDYRLVAFGALLPLFDVVVGRSTPLHGLLAPILVLTLVMVTTIGRRLLRRRLLGVPIGMFLHLVLDGAWSDTALFWWPAFGPDLAGVQPPEAGGVVLRLLLEPLALAVGWWAWSRYGLDRADNRERLWRTGHLDRRMIG